MIEAGKYVAKVFSGVFGEAGEKKTPGVSLTFRISQGPETGKDVQWVGWLSEKAAERTIETLMKLGYQEDKDLNPGRTFDASFLTDPNKEVELVIEMEPGYKDPSKSYPKVKWINELGGSNKFLGANPEQTTFGVNLKSAFAAVRAKNGIAAPAVDHSVDNLPF